MIVVSHDPSNRNLNAFFLSQGLESFDPDEHIKGAPLESVRHFLYAA
jgi:hypothetical protein